MTDLSTEAFHAEVKRRGLVLLQEIEAEIARRGYRTFELQEGMIKATLVQRIVILEMTCEDLAHDIATLKNKVNQ